MQKEALSCVRMIGLAMMILAGLGLNSAIAKPVLEVSVKDLQSINRPAVGPETQWLSTAAPRIDPQAGLVYFSDHLHFGAAYKPMKIDGKEARIELTFAPSVMYYVMLDGHFFSLVDDQGKTVCRLDMMRRGRYRLTCGDQVGRTSMIKWISTWRNGAEARPIRVIWNNTDARLEIGNETLLTLKDVPAFKSGTYQLRVGRLEDETSGARGWYSGWRVDASDDISKPAPMLDLVKTDKRFAPLIELERQLVPATEDFPCGIPTEVNTKLARKAAARITLDAMWVRTYNNKDSHYQEFLAALQKMAEEIKTDKAPAEIIPLPAPSTGGRWLLDDKQLYYGSCGWELACYAPEFASLGLNMVSIQIWPDVLFDDEGKLSTRFVERSALANLDEAAKYGIKVDIAIPPLSPAYMLKKHPEWDGKITSYGNVGEADTESQLERQGRLAGQGFLKASVIAPDYLEMAEHFFAGFLPMIKGHPALACYDLGNEPQIQDYTMPMQKRFREYLVKKYQTVEALNLAWISSYKSFNDIIITREMAFEFDKKNRYWDWVDCNHMIGAEHFRLLQQMVRKYDPVTPTHIKTLPYEFGLPWYTPGSIERNNYDYADGIDRLNFIRTTDLAGTDSWADKFNPPGKYSLDNIYQTMYFELIGHFAGGKPIYDSEYHIITCEPPTTPPDFLEAVMPANAVAGLRAGAIWITCTLINQPIDLTSNAPLLYQYGLTSAKLRSLQDKYVALSERPRPIALLYSPKAKFLQGDSYILALQRLFEVGFYTGLGVRLIDERELIDGEIDGIKAIVSINCRYTLEETPKALERFSQAGGQVVLVGAFATQNKTVPVLAEGANVEKVELTSAFDELYAVYMTLAKKINALPTVQVGSVDGKAVEGLQWHTRTLDNGNVIVFAVNMLKTPLTIKLAGKGELVDLADGKKSEIRRELSPRGIFLGEFRKK